MSDEAATLARLRWAKRETIICEHCGEPFSGPPGQRYCTPKHQRAAASRRYRRKRRRPAASGRGEGEEG